MRVSAATLRALEPVQKEDLALRLCPEQERAPMHREVLGEEG